jgi:outer membrane protein OmpA-like peptidoglycan-associated protein
MLHPTGEGKIATDSRYSGRGMIKARLYNFDVDGDKLKPEHELFLLKDVIRLLESDTGHIWMQGSASRSGPEIHNMGLSTRRVTKVASFLRRHGILDRQMQPEAIGEAGTQGHLLEEEYDIAR